MAWICPKFCHEEEDFSVMRTEYRADAIVHYYSGNDGSLANELGDPKVYVGEESTYDRVQCAKCESEVHWEYELGVPTVTGDAPEQLARLFEACRNDLDRDTLTQIARKAGLLWNCEVCQYENHEEDEVCADCGAPRPDEFDEENRDG